jgi:D-inositol-3-phosphate glycosyltransferase
MYLMRRVRRRLQSFIASIRGGAWPPSRSFFSVPRGYIDSPIAESTVELGPVQLLGWCLFPGASVTCVELSVGGAPPQRARLGMPRADIARFSDHPDAPICGFEYVVDLRRLGAAGGGVAVTGVAHASDGRRLSLGPLELNVAARRVSVDEARAAELRARYSRHLPLPARRTDGGVRLLAFSHQLPYGGASLYLFELLRRFAAQDDFECTVVSLEDGPLRQGFEEIGIPVHLTDGFPVSSLERYEGSLAELTAWAAPQGFNAAFVNTVACFSGTEVARRLGIPAVWAVHESYDLPIFWFTAYEPGTLDPYVSLRGERSLRDASAVVFEAESTRRLYLPYAEADRLIAQPYGIELRDIAAARTRRARSEARRRLGVPDEAKLVLCLGTVEPRKSQAMLTRAFASVADRHPDALLALVGKIDAPWCAAYVAGIHDFVDRAGLSDRVRIEPVTPETHDWHLASDVHVCASDVESLPRSVLEAMAFERPVVSTAVFGVSEVIDDGRTGYLCQTRDAAALARRLDEVLAADPAELRGMTAAAAAKMSRDHDPDRYADRLWRLVTGLVDDPNAEPRTLLGVDAPGPDPGTTEMRVRSGS